MDRILIVEDEAKIARVVRAYLENEGFAVEEASDGLKALEMVEDFDFALIILDLMLPHISGEDVCKQLRRQGNSVPIIMLTAKGAEEERIRGLGLGADDYVVKPFSPGELVARVQAVLRRYRASSAKMTEVMEFVKSELVIDTQQRLATLKGTVLDLTATEFKLLAAMAKSPGRVFTRGELLEIAQGALATGFDRTIDSHIKNLRHKVESKPDEPSLIRTVYGVGYKFTGE